MGGLSNLYGDSSNSLNGGTVVSEVFEFETAATNYCLYSSDFSNAAWAKAGGCVVTPNTNLAPNAVVEADTITGGNILQSPIAVLNTNLFYCFSLYVLAGTSVSTHIQFFLSGISNQTADVVFNPVTGQITLDANAIPAQVTLVSILGVNWFRVSLRIQNTLLNTHANVWIFPDASPANNKSIIAWGAQIEASTVNVNLPSSPIPTTAASVARTGGIIAPWLMGSGGALPAVPTAGKILRSDGTNWATSQDTWPDIVAANNVLFASAANTVSSDATFKYSATAGVGLQLANLLDISGANGGQIKFPATQNPSSNANTMDDYEEGTWTPTDVSGAGLSLTVVADGCTYLKSGQGVNLAFDFTFPATANGAQITIGGVPFTVGGTTNRPYGGAIIGSSGIANCRFGLTGAGTNFFVFTAGANIEINSALSAAYLRGNGFYRASA